MKVVIDHALCEGNAVCEALAPELFEVDDDGQAQLLVGEVGEEHRAVVERAVMSCPRMAIAVSGQV